MSLDPQDPCSTSFNVGHMLSLAASANNGTNNS